MFKMMAKKNTKYQKLPGSKKGFLLGKHTLWQGTDHLLQIFSRMGVEDYKRFYFSDIQAIITRKTIVGKVQNVIFAGFIMLLALPAFLLDEGWSMFFAAAAGVPLVFLFVNIVRGPTCETKLMTAVQTEKMHSLHRLKNTLKVMDRLQPYIQRVQGNITPEDREKTPVRQIDGNPSEGRMKPAGSPKIAARQEKGRMHMILFMLLLIDGVLVAVGFLFTHVALTILSAVAGICMGIFVIIALVKQHNSDLPASLQTITWASLGYVGIAFIAGYAVSIMFAFKNPGTAYNQWEFFKSMSALSPWESRLKLGFDIYTLCGAFFLGIPGLFLLKRPENGKKKIIVAKSSRQLNSGNPLPG
jgi:hypothetical protein